MDDDDATSTQEPTPTPELIRALIAADEHALWVIGYQPPHDPDERERWMAHKNALERQIEHFRMELQKALSQRAKRTMSP